MTYNGGIIPKILKGPMPNDATDYLYVNMLFFQVHVNLMILESRMQAELMYALRTVNIYMTN